MTPEFLRESRRNSSLVWHPEIRQAKDSSEVCRFSFPTTECHSKKITLKQKGVKCENLKKKTSPLTMVVCFQKNPLPLWPGVLFLLLKVTCCPPGPAEDLSTAPYRAAPKVGGNNCDGTAYRNLASAETKPQEMPLKIKMEHNSLEVWFRSLSFLNGMMAIGSSRFRLPGFTVWPHSSCQKSRARV